MKPTGEFVRPERRVRGVVAKITNLGTLIARHEVMDGSELTVAVILDGEKIIFRYYPVNFPPAQKCKE